MQPNPQLSKDGVWSAPFRQFRPFSLLLHGYLPGDVIREGWRFSCQREGLHLEMLDAVKVRDRLAKPKRKKKKRQRAKAALPQSE